MNQALPGPVPHILLRRHGNAHAYTQDPIRYTANLYHEYGPVCGLVRGDSRQVFAFGPEHNRTVMTGRDTFHTVLEYAIPERIRRARRGIGLLNMNGSEHREARRAVMPAFVPHAIAEHAQLVAELAADEVDSWVTGAPFDLVEAMRRLTLRIACRCFFGVDIAGEASTIGSMVNDMLGLRYFATSIRYFPFEVPGAPYNRLLKVIRRLDDALAGIVAARRGQVGQSDLLSALIAARDSNGFGLTDDQLIGQLTTLLIAGHETSSNTLTWAFLLLSQHDSDLQAVLSSISERFVGRPVVTSAAVADPRVDQVLKEVLRLLPPGPNTARITVEPTEIGGFEVPAWCQVVISKFTTHRDPEVFTDPLQFRPSRWEQGTKPSLYRYMPYGAGPHACIGAAFADLEMKIIIATALSRFRIDPVPNTEVSRKVGLMMAPRGPVPVVARPRDAAIKAIRPLKGDIHQMVDLDGSSRWRLGW